MGIWGVGTGGAKGLSYLAGWGLLISIPFGGMVGGGGRLDPQHLRVGAEVKVLPGDQQRPGSQGREGRHEGRERTSG